MASRHHMVEPGTGSPVVPGDGRWCPGVVPATSSANLRLAVRVGGHWATGGAAASWQHSHTQYAGRIQVTPALRQQPGVCPTPRGGAEMADRTCSIQGCNAPHNSRGWCRKHYERWCRHGDPLYTCYVVGDDVERFWSHVDRRSDCWLWTSALDNHGYGAFTLPGKTAKAHRYAYELLVGPIPDGLTLDHVKARGCRHRHCVNPAHLEPVSRGVNTMRGASPLAINARKTHCKNGHEFTPENTIVRPSGRRCRTCDRAWRARRRSERRAS